MPDDSEMDVLLEIWDEFLNEPGILDARQFLVLEINADVPAISCPEHVPPELLRELGPLPEGLDFIELVRELGPEFWMEGSYHCCTCVACYALVFIHAPEPPFWELS